MLTFIMAGLSAWAQPSGGTDQRMNRDLEVAENILSTMLRQESGRRGFFPVEVKGSYVAGYGVTFRLPMNFGRFPMGAVWSDDMPGAPAVAYSYSYSSADEAREVAERARDDARREQERAQDRRIQEKDQLRVKTTRAPKARQAEEDSAASRTRQRFMEVSRNFLADYGDVIGGLKSEERIIVTNRADNYEPDFDMVWISGGKQSRRALLSVEAKRGDIEQLKQGKITRDEFMKRLKIVDTESSEAVDPDLEVFSSLFGRLYREDLSTTYYTQGSIHYERLKDFGVMYYMKVYSSMEVDNGNFMIPTLDLLDVTKAERDKKVKELYPKFESELKDNLVEYGRTLRSLSDDESLVFNVKLTKCEGCGIPAGLELSIKASALKDYGSGKATKEATMAKISVKKNGVQ